MNGYLAGGYNRIKASWCPCAWAVHKRGPVLVLAVPCCISICSAFPVSSTNRILFVDSTISEYNIIPR